MSIFADKYAKSIKVPARTGRVDPVAEALVKKVESILPRRP